MAGGGETPKEACGVFGVYAPGQPVAQLTYLGLYALQHRGQESAGMAVSDGHGLTVVKDMGLVSDVVRRPHAGRAAGPLAIGHTRYSTTGSSTWRNAQPVYRDVGQHEFALGHNGNLVNTEALADEAGMLPGTVTSDSDLVAELLAHELAAWRRRRRRDGAPLERALTAVLPRSRARSRSCSSDDGHIIGVRDPNGFRPLCLGRLDGGWVLASETPALDIVGAHFVRELEPGEMVVIDAAGRARCGRSRPSRSSPGCACSSSCTSPDPTPAVRPQRAPGPRAHGRAARRAGAGRRRHGDGRARVGRCRPPRATPGQRHPVRPGLVKNRYIGRTFIAPSQELRARACA